MAKETKPYTRPDPESAAELFAYLGDPVEQQMARITERSAALLRWLKDPSRAQSKERHAEIKREGLDKLQHCCVVLSLPAPRELIDLITFLLDVSNHPRSAPRTRTKWREAARYFAAHPQASNREVALATGADGKTVAAWKKEREFQTRIRALKLLARPK
jgi:hypothetical protein